MTEEEREQREELEQEGEEDMELRDEQAEDVRGGLIDKTRPLK